MKRIATVSPVWGCSVEDLRALAKEAERGGFEAIFSPEVPPYRFPFYQRLIKNLGFGTLWKR